MKAVGYLSTEFPDYWQFVEDNQDYIERWYNNLIKFLPRDDYDSQDEYDFTRCSVIAVGMIHDVDLDDLQFPLPFDHINDNICLELADCLWLFINLMTLKKLGLISYDPKNRTYTSTDKGTEVVKLLKKEKDESN